MTEKKSALKPAETFPLCEHLLDEMKARKWTRSYLAKRLLWPQGRLDRVLSGARILMAEAEDLGRVFQVSAVLFLNLQLVDRR